MTAEPERGPLCSFRSANARHAAAGTTAPIAGGRLDTVAFQFSTPVRFAEAFGLETLIFEAPNKPSQFALLDHFGTRVHLCNVRLEEVLRVEIYRRGLHSDAFANPRLRPPLPMPVEAEAEAEMAGVVRFAGIRE